MKFKILYITLLAIISILMYYINFEFIYNYYSYVGPNKEFGDLDLLLRGIDHFRNGENPFLIQEKTPFNYPSTWSFFSLIDVINRDNLRFIGVFITFLTFLLLLLSLKFNFKNIWLYLLVFISPISILIFQRGNSDLIILNIILLFFLLFKNKIQILNFGIFICFALKLYPIAWFVINFANSLNKRNIYNLVFIGFMILSFLIFNFDEILQIKTNTPFSLDVLSYGAKILYLKYIFYSHKILLFFITFIILLFIGLHFYYSRYNLVLHNLENEMFLFIIGASTFCFTYLFTISWTYRLFYLILCFPFLLKQNIHFRFLLFSIMLVFYSQTFEIIFKGYSIADLINHILLLFIFTSLFYTLFYIIVKQFKIKCLNSPSLP